MPNKTTACGNDGCTVVHTYQEHMLDLFDAYTIAHDLLTRLIPKHTSDAQQQQRFDEITRNYITKTDVELWFRAYGYLLHSTQRTDDNDHV